jgi:hypothetical protein
MTTVLLDPASELDTVIRELGEKMVQANQHGDRAGARDYLERMTAAIKSRTPEHQAELDAENFRRIDELTFQGQWTEQIGARVDVSAQAVRRRMA